MFFLGNPLTSLFNICIREGIYPADFKLSRTIPIFKNGERHRYNDYRPIYLILIFFKVFEVILKDQLYEYFEGGGFLTGEQFSFRKERSTIVAICRLFDCIVEGFEEGDFVGVTFCDVSRIFYCISHGILVNKLEFYGLGEESVVLLQITCQIDDRRLAVGENYQGRKL